MHGHGPSPADSDELDLSAVDVVARCEYIQRRHHIFHTLAQQRPPDMDRQSRGAMFDVEEFGGALLGIVGGLTVAANVNAQNEALLTH